MHWVDLILNFAGLLLWINWRSGKAPATMALPGISLVSTLRRAGQTQSHWRSLVGLLLLLAVRPLVYWQIGSAADWTALVPLGPVSLAFRSDFPGRMFLFSLMSFGLVLFVFYLWLVLFSVVNNSVPAADPQQSFVRLQLGWFDRWPLVLRWMLPMLGAVGLWSALAPLLWKAGITPPAVSAEHVLEQGAVFGLRGYLSWRYPIAAVLLLYLVNSYVYLGTHSIWNHVNVTGRALLRPLAWLPLRAGKADFAPIVGIALVFLAGEFGERWLGKIFQKLPL